MNECILREYRKDDIPALSDLWARVFGDSRELIDTFFRLLPEMGSGVAAVQDGRVVGGAYAITGLSLTGKDGLCLPCGYLYAVAVEPACRGKGVGAALSRTAFALGRERGAQILCTQPAEESLFAWYKRILDVDCVLRRREEVIPAGEAGLWHPLSPAEYGARREALLNGQDHLTLSPAALSFQQALCRTYGGDFFAAGRAVAAAVIRELLRFPEEDRSAAAASLAARMGAREALLCTPDARGVPYLAAQSGSLPADCVWNLSFD